MFLIQIINFSEVCSVFFQWFLVRLLTVDEIEEFDLNVTKSRGYSGPVWGKMKFTQQHICLTCSIPNLVSTSINETPGQTPIHSSLSLHVNLNIGPIHYDVLSPNRAETLVNFSKSKEQGFSWGVNNRLAGQEIRCPYGTRRSVVVFTRAFYGPPTIT
jgi:hypothetical protein